ncbi:MAG: hypothetical protein WCS12_04530 [Acholeplasmataceae bacterium]
MEAQVKKTKHGAGGFFFSLDKKGNTRLGVAKRKAIIKALQHSWTEGVYQTPSGEIKRQLLNGVAQFLKRDEFGEYYFA